MKADLSDRIRRHIEERFDRAVPRGIIDFSECVRRHDNRVRKDRHYASALEDFGLDLLMREQIINMTSQDARDYRGIQESVEKAMDEGRYHPGHLRWIIHMKCSILSRYCGEEDLTYPFLRARVLGRVERPEYPPDFPQMG